MITPTIDLGSMANLCGQLMLIALPIYVAFLANTNPDGAPGLLRHRPLAALLIFFGFNLGTAAASFAVGLALGLTTIQALTLTMVFLLGELLLIHCLNAERHTQQQAGTTTQKDPDAHTDRNP